MTSRQLQSVQVLRGVAALAVVCHHAFRSVTVYRPPDMAFPPPLLLGNTALVELGSAGVDIFFVVSGFIMCHITSESRSQTAAAFMAGRFGRIWPLYALATAIACIPLIFGALSSGHPPFDLQPMRLGSFLFLPSFNERGALQPIVGVGWTLNYEMLFYLCFAAALACARRLAGFAVAAMILGLFVLGRLLPSSSVAGSFLGDGILFEFLFGVVIGKWAKRNGPPQKYALLLIVAGILGFIAFANVSVATGWRAMTRGVPAALLLFGMLALESRIRWHRIAVSLGDASYSTYLIHTQIIFWISVLLFPVLHSNLPVIAPEATALIAIVAGQCAGLLCHRWVEEPLREGWRACFGTWSRKREVEA